MNKQELFALAINPAGDLTDRYDAARALQSQRVAGDIVTNVVRLYPFWTVNEIAEKLNVSVNAVNGVAGKYGLPLKIC